MSAPMPKVGDRYEWRSGRGRPARLRVARVWRRAVRCESARFNVTFYDWSRALRAGKVKAV